jgi:hypothetical protein
MCQRALKKYLRKWIKLELGRKIAPDEQRMLLKRVKPIE